MRIGTITDDSARIVNRAARPVTGVVEDYDSLLDLVGDQIGRAHV